MSTFDQSIRQTSNAPSLNSCLLHEIMAKRHPDIAVLSTSEANGLQSVVLHYKRSTETEEQKIYRVELISLPQTISSVTLQFFASDAASVIYLCESSRDHGLINAILDWSEVTPTLSPSTSPPLKVIGLMHRHEPDSEFRDFISSICLSRSFGLVHMSLPQSYYCTKPLLPGDKLLENPVSFPQLLDQILSRCVDASVEFACSIEQGGSGIIGDPASCLGVLNQVKLGPLILHDNKYKKELMLLGCGFSPVSFLLENQIAQRRLSDNSNQKYNSQDTQNTRHIQNSDNENIQNAGNSNKKRQSQRRKKGIFSSEILHEHAASNDFYYSPNAAPVTESGLNSSSFPPLNYSQLNNMVQFQSNSNDTSKSPQQPSSLMADVPPASPPMSSLLDAPPKHQTHPSPNKRIKEFLGLDQSPQDRADKVVSNSTPPPFTGNKKDETKHFPINETAKMKSFNKSLLPDSTPNVEPFTPSQSSPIPANSKYTPRAPMDTANSPANRLGPNSSPSRLQGKKATQRTQPFGRLLSNHREDNDTENGDETGTLHFHVTMSPIKRKNGGEQNRTDNFNDSEVKISPLNKNESQRNTAQWQQNSKSQNSVTHMSHVSSSIYADSVNVNNKTANPATASLLVDQPPAKNSFATAAAVATAVSKFKDQLNKKDSKRNTNYNQESKTVPYSNSKTLPLKSGMHANTEHNEKDIQIHGTANRNNPLQEPLSSVTRMNEKILFNKNKTASESFSAMKSRNNKSIANKNNLDKNLSAERNSVFEEDPRSDLEVFYHIVANENGRSHRNGQNIGMETANVLTEAVQFGKLDNIINEDDSNPKTGIGKRHTMNLHNKNQQFKNNNAATSPQILKGNNFVVNSRSANGDSQYNMSLNQKGKNLTNLKIKSQQRVNLLPPIQKQTTSRNEIGKDNKKMNNNNTNVSKNKFNSLKTNSTSRLDTQLSQNVELSPSHHNSNQSKKAGSSSKTKDETIPVNGENNKMEQNTPQMRTYRPYSYEINGAH